MVSHLYTFSRIHSYFDSMQPHCSDCDRTASLSSQSSSPPVNSLLLSVVFAGLRGQSVVMSGEVVDMAPVLRKVQRDDAHTVGALISARA